MQIASANEKMPSTLHVNYFDSNQARTQPITHAHTHRSPRDFLEVSLFSGPFLRTPDPPFSVVPGAQTMMYTFYKYNPRTEPGHRDGDLGSPPAPGFGGHGVGLNSEPLIIMGGAFLVVAVALCLFGAASHARRRGDATRDATRGAPRSAPNLHPTHHARICTAMHSSRPLTHSPTSAPPQAAQLHGSHQVRSAAYAGRPPCT